MEEQYNKFELLAIHLAPRFGNIYEYNIPEGGIVGYDVQGWTDELRKVVRNYLLHELPADVGDRLLNIGNGESLTATGMESLVNKLVEFEPWEVALAVHNAAVAAVPTLHELIGHLDDWPSEDERSDTETWLLVHGEDVSWHEILSSKYFERIPAWTTTWPQRPLEPYDLVHILKPGELLDAWEVFFGPSESDLTDEEWRLILPHFGLRRSRRGEFQRSQAELDAKRRTLNGIRFKMSHDVQWTQVPARYGHVFSIYQSYRYYQRSGMFYRLYQGLRTNHQPRRIVAWLEQVVNSDQVGSATSTEATT
ncbi:transposase [Nocardia ninae]|uniref:Insertion element IS402-like domain-containing protein n=1 Tax=Nocardia ninae NBRC 108245 TaxID=1210091 RepID=A0A511MCY5_9NOCA|nr:transposase [Nocardia ninae]GEM38535.1 hypothetical protein NN4_30540 [Nocardia ninae NBRC 108245]